MHTATHCIMFASIVIMFASHVHQNLFFPMVLLDTILQTCFPFPLFSITSDSYLLHISLSSICVLVILPVTRTLTKLDFTTNFSVASMTLLYKKTSLFSPLLHGKGAFSQVSALSALSPTLTTYPP